MPAHRHPKPLTASELREIHATWGKDRLVRVLLWEISRLRSVVKLLYRHVCRLTQYSAEPSAQSLDADLEDAIEHEPVILEESRRGASEPKMPQKRRWAHMSEEHEARLVADMEGGPSQRELKRKSREAR